MRAKLELAFDSLDVIAVPARTADAAASSASPRRSRHLAVLHVALRIALVAACIAGVLQLVTD